MYHRMGIASMTGLGNPNPSILKNKWTDNKNRNSLIKTMFDEALKLFFKGVGFDFEIAKDYISFGLEPSYQWEHLYIVRINKIKKHSSMSKGIAWGGYGSEIVQTTKIYEQYKNKSKFVKFVDKWHEILF